MNTFIKKTVLPVILSLLTAATASAQESEVSTATSGETTFVQQHELTLSVGWIPSPNYYSIPELNYNPMTREGAAYTCGAWTAAYGYNFKKWLYVGGAISYYGEFGAVYSNFDNSKIRNESDNLISIMPTVRFTWLNRKWVKLYSSLAIGIGVEIEKRQHTSSIMGFSGKISPIGIAIGKSLYGFAELSAGLQGFALVGIGYRFNDKKQTK